MRWLVVLIFESLNTNTTGGGNAIHAVGWARIAVRSACMIEALSTNFV